MSGVSGLPVAPLRSTPWQPAQRWKQISLARSKSASVRSGAPGVCTTLASVGSIADASPRYAAAACSGLEVWAKAAAVTVRASTLDAVVSEVVILMAVFLSVIQIVAKR